MNNELGGRMDLSEGAEAAGAVKAVVSRDSGAPMAPEISAVDMAKLEKVETEMAELAVHIHGLTGDTRTEELPGKLAKVRALADERRVLAQGPVVTPIGPRETVDRIDVTNEVFLKTLFGSDYERAHCAAFKEDPHELEKLGLRWKWGGDAFPRVTFTRGQNQYFTVSLFHRESGDKSRRRKAQFEGLYVLMLDDIGSGASAKVSPDVLNNLLRPSYALMTSPDNHQCGLLLEWPETERGRAEALINGMVKHGLATDGKDPGQAGVTRYAKLPASFNTKHFYVDAMSPEGFEAVLTRWAPDLVYTVDEIAACLGLVLPRPGSAEAKGVAKAGGGSLVERYGQLGLTMADDPLLLVLNELGMVSGRTSGDDGWLIICPKVHEHTGGDESGTALMDDGRLVCHHGHPMGYSIAWDALRDEDGRSQEEIAIIRKYYAKAVALEFAEGELATLAEAIDTPVAEWKPEVMDALAAVRGLGVVPEFRDTVEASVPEAERLDFEMELDGKVAEAAAGREKAKAEAKPESRERVGRVSVCDFTAEEIVGAFESLAEKSAGKDSVVFDVEVMQLAAQYGVQASAARNLAGALSRRISGKASEPPADFRDLRIDPLERATAPLSPTCIVDGYLYADVALLAATGGTGKTTQILYECVCIILGMDLWGNKVVTPGPCLIITAEDTRKLLLGRLNAIMVGMGLDPHQMAQVDANLSIWDTTEELNRLVDIDVHGGYAVTPLVDKVVSAAKAMKPVMIVFDPIVSFGPSVSALNDMEQMLILAGRKMFRPLDCCVRFVTHVSQNVARGGLLDQHAPRGGTALPDGSRMVAVLASAGPDLAKGAPASLNVTPETALTRMARPKLSFGPKQPVIWIARNGFEYQWAVETDEMDSSVAVPAVVVANRAYYAVDAYIRDEAAQGHEYSREELYARKAQIGEGRGVGGSDIKLTRTQVREAVTYLLSENPPHAVEDQKPPIPGKVGARPKVVRPTGVPVIEPTPHFVAAPVSGGSAGGADDGFGYIEDDSDF
jgi:RecA-family ATPase